MNNKKVQVTSCPYCGNLLRLKKDEPYKRFYICPEIDCEAVSVIITTTTKS